MAQAAPSEQMTADLQLVIPGCQDAKQCTPRPQDSPGFCRVRLVIEADQCADGGITQRQTGGQGGVESQSGITAALELDAAGMSFKAQIAWGKEWTQTGAREDPMARFRKQVGDLPVQQFPGLQFMEGPVRLERLIGAGLETAGNKIQGPGAGQVITVALGAAGRSILDLQRIMAKGADQEKAGGVDFRGRVR